MPIEDLRKLYTTSTSIINVPSPKLEEGEREISTSEKDSSDDDDSDYRRLLIAENPNPSKQTN